MPVTEKFKVKELLLQMLHGLIVCKGSMRK